MVHGVRRMLARALAGGSAQGALAGCGAGERTSAGLESEERQKLGAHATSRSPRWARAGGLRTALHSNSLLIVMGATRLQAALS